MADVETMSFLAYWLSKLPAEPIVSDNTLLIRQGDTIREIDMASFETALFNELGMGPAVTVIEETTLNGNHGRVLINAAEGTTVLIHMPAYGSVSAYKSYRMKNIGLGKVTYNAIDGKTINGEASLDLYPGDQCEVYKGEDNWQA